MGNKSIADALRAKALTFPSAEAADAKLAQENMVKRNSEAVNRRANRDR